MLANRFSGKAKLILTAIGVFQIFFASIAANVMDPALQDLTTIYPDIARGQIAAVVTVPNLASIPASLISGVLTGRRWKYRTTLSISFTLIILGGITPMILYSFSTVIVARVVF